MSEKIQLTIITQEKQLLDVVVDQITVMTTSGEITVLPNHIPLFTRLQTGELVYKKNGETHSVILSGGFLDVSPDSTITVLADTASLEEDITLAKAEEAKRKAEDSMAQKTDRRNFMIAEASLRKALLELKVARRRGGQGRAPQV